MNQSLHERPMPDKSPLQRGWTPIAPPPVTPAWPDGLSCAEVIERARERFGWQSFLQATAFVASVDAKDRLAESMNELAEAEELQ